MLSRTHKLVLSVTLVVVLCAVLLIIVVSNQNHKEQSDSGDLYQAQAVEGALIRLLNFTAEEDLDGKTHYSATILVSDSVQQGELEFMNDPNFSLRLSFDPPGKYHLVETDTTSHALLAKMTTNIDSPPQALTVSLGTTEKTVKFLLPKNNSGEDISVKEVVLSAVKNVWKNTTQFFSRLLPI